MLQYIYVALGNKRSKSMSSEAITQNDLTNILNEVLPVSSVDYVIAQGSNYRKWNSGLAECWGLATVGSNSACTTYYPITFSTTSGMVLTASCEYLSAGTYVAPTISVQKYTDRCNLYARCSTSTVQAGYTIAWHVTGTWR